MVIVTLTNILDTMTKDRSHLALPVFQPLPATKLPTLFQFTLYPPPAWLVYVTVPARSVQNWRRSRCSLAPVPGRTFWRLSIVFRTREPVGAAATPKMTKTAMQSSIKDIMFNNTASKRWTLIAFNTCSCDDCGDEMTFYKLPILRIWRPPIGMIYRKQNGKIGSNITGAVKLLKGVISYGDFCPIVGCKLTPVASIPAMYIEVRDWGSERFV